MSALAGAVLRLIRPALTAWAAWHDADLASMPRPLGLPRAVADGPRADRVLLIGSGPAVGWGVASHDIALPGALARALRAATGRGAIVDVIADSSLRAVHLPTLLSGLRRDRYDAVITTVGINDAARATTPREWEDLMEFALDLWSDRAEQRTMLLLVGVLPVRAMAITRGVAGVIADRLSRTYNGITDRLVEGRDRVQTTLLPELTPLSRTARGRRTPDDYATWGRQLAAELVDHLDAAALDREMRELVDERATTGIPDAEHVRDVAMGDSESLVRLVSHAASAFRTPTALLTVLGTDTQWHIARVGIEQGSLPIEQSFCATAVRADDGLVVPDATADPRFAENPLVAGDPHVRYYAGVPIEDPDGRRIGALCVIDTQPRNLTSEADLGLLRSLAARAQQVLWASMLGEKRAGDGRVAASPS